jgi:hypothetical protein
MDESDDEDVEYKIQGPLLFGVRSTPHLLVVCVGGFVIMGVLARLWGAGPGFECCEDYD